VAARTLSRGLIVPLFIPLANLGGLAVTIGVVRLLIAGLAGVPDALAAIAAGALLFWLGTRPRVVTFDPASGEVTVAWGLPWPLVFRRVAPDGWTGFRVTVERPVGLTARGGGRTSATALPPRWRAWGMTRRGASVSLATPHTEAEAVALRKELAEAARVREHLAHLTVRLTWGPPPAGPEHTWRSVPFFASHPRAAALYAALGERGRWRHVRGGGAYDADVPEELERSDFDVGLIASEEGIARPWALLLELERAGWVSAAPNLEEPDLIARLAEIERRHGWASPAMARPRLASR
jgi:hypothetical protein